MMMVGGRVGDTMNNELPVMKRTVLMFLIVTVGLTKLFAARDDEVPPPPEPNQQNHFVQVDANFDQWVFQGSGNAEASRQQIKSRLKLQIDEIDRVCKLNKDQKDKLMLAASGDAKRFFDQVDEVRKKFLANKNDQNAMGQIWQDIQPLHMKLASGLFGDKSLFGKTLRSTLDTRQSTDYKAIADERKQYRYRASIEVALATLENSIALRDQEREALIKLLVEETRPPETFGQYDYYFVMNRLSKFPESKIKPLFNERQWKLLRQQFNQARSMEPLLVRNGVILLEN